MEKGKDIVDIINLLENNAANDRTFGQYIRECREALGKTVRSFAVELDMTPAYLSDIEKGNRYAPKNKLDLIFSLLQLPEEQRAAFMDLAALTRGEFEDINPYLEKQHWACVALRKAREVDLSSEKWKELIEQMN